MVEFMRDFIAANHWSRYPSKSSGGRSPAALGQDLDLAAIVQFPDWISMI
jgi:hypothetical protein